MAIHLSHSDDGLVETHDINVTPFIDVMLVLLVIFMITAPLSTVDVPVNLPVAKADQKPPEVKPVYLTLQADYGIAVGDTHIDRNAFASAIVAATSGNRDTRIFLRADKSVDYDHLMELLNELGDAGYLKIALVGREQAAGHGDNSGG